MSNRKIYNCIVIGGGAAGLFFAAKQTGGSASRLGLQTDGAANLILEKTASPGTKLLISGGGHCNITHEGQIKDFIPHYGENGKLIRKILYKHSNLELIGWLSESGIGTITEEDGRVFPESKSSKEVLRFLMEKANANGFEIKTNSPVKAIRKSDNLWELECESNGAVKTYKGRTIVVATGGLSYPKTGSDGSMFEILKRDLDVKITNLTPALSPIKVSNYPYSELSGISLDALVEVTEGANRRKKSLGAVLFTHNSFSGPGIINISGDLSPGDKMSINYLYPMDYSGAFSKLQESITGNKSKLSTIVSDTFDLPKRFARIIADRSQGSTKQLAKLLTQDQFTVTESGNFSNAMVTRGGISLEEIDLTTMEFINHPGLFAIGEALNVDGETGGYNLQFAYSSASTVSINP